MRRGFLFYNLDILKCEIEKKNNTMMITYSQNNIDTNESYIN